MENKQLVTMIVAGVLILLIGIGLGFVIQSQGKQEKAKTETINKLSSRVISSITAYGKVAKIEGSNITLNSLGDESVVSLASNVKIFAFDASVAGKIPVQKSALLGDIKVGDNVNMSIKMLPTGQMQGLSVTILPQS